MADHRHAAQEALPNRAGVGLKPQHYDVIVSQRPDIGWFEVHPENYMGAGGPPHHYLTRVRESYPLSLHGVGLSIGGAGGLDTSHLDRLKALIDCYEPQSFSEHLAWSSHEAGYFNDLLPLPYTGETLDVICRHIDETQSHVGRRLLLENPSTYVVFAESTYDEIDFLSEIARRTGCGLLLDVNNVYVSCANQRRIPETYIDRFLMHHVGEIHLAGHVEQRDESGEPLLIDSHDRKVIDAVWQLYARALTRAGPRPTLVEWDDDIPEWDVLLSEAQAAERILRDEARKDQFGVRSHADALV